MSSAGPASWGRVARLARVAAAALALGVAGPAAAEKTDVVVLVNGDRITGEIKGMTRGKLDYSTDDAGRLSIQWIKIVQVTSPHRFELETSSGRRLFSPLVAPERGAQGVVRLDDGETLPIPEVVSIVPLASAFLARVQAYLDLGVTVARSNSAKTLAGDGFVQYRGERAGTSLAFDVYGQDAADSAPTNRGSIKLTGDLYLGRWTPQLWGQAEKNDELGLQRRLSLGSGAAYAAYRSDATELNAKAGLVGLQEDYVDRDPALSLSGLLSVSWETFRYDSPKLDLGVALAAYPYLTDPGRVRVEGSLRVKYELISDFDVGLSFSDTFDTRPPDPTAARNDYLVTMTIGWSYRR